MLEEKDLQAIAQIMDVKLAQTKDEILTTVREDLAKQKDEILTTVREDLAKQKDEILTTVRSDMAKQKDEILTTVREDMAKQKDEILDETTHRMKVLLENEVDPKFNLLAEGQQIIMEQLVPSTRVDKLDNEVDVLKSAVRQLSDEVQTLKQAN